MKQPFPDETRSPLQVAQRIEATAAEKVRGDRVSILTLAVLAGAFISLGALFFLAILTGAPDSGLGVSRLLGGLGFSLGLVLVVLAGAELFTGNNLIAIAWASGTLSAPDLARHWAIVYVGNVLGCLGTAGLVAMSGVHELGAGELGELATGVARAKADLPFVEAFARGILCNALVCLAIWIAMAGKTASDKILAILLPISAFVAIGFEHSIANWFFFPYAALLDPGDFGGLGALSNLVVVSLGNIVGGTGLVALVYWIAVVRAPET